MKNIIKEQIDWNKSKENTRKKNRIIPTEDTIDNGWNTITDSELLKKLNGGGGEFWNKIRVGIPAIIKTARGYVYKKNEDLEHWWKEYKKNQNNDTDNTSEKDEITTSSTEW